MAALRPDSLRPEAFEELLHWLADDRDRAAEKYEAIRARLIRLFICRGAVAAEDLADAAIDRVIHKLPEMGARYKGDPAAYFYRVAQFIWFEHRRKARPVLAPPPADPVADRED